MKNPSPLEIRIKLIESLKSLPPNTLVFLTHDKHFTSTQMQEELIKDTPSSRLFVQYTIDQAKQLIHDVNKGKINSFKDFMKWTNE